MNVRKTQVKINVDVLKLAENLDGRYVSVKELAGMLATNTYAAGRILRLMELYGLAVRHSRWVYKIKARG